MYFSYSELVFGYTNVSFWAIMMRFAIPFVVGVATGLFGATRTELTVGAAATSVLLVWPPIALPEVVLPTEL
jgi:hypothetical protein